MILKRLLKRLSVLVFFCICYFFSSVALATDTAVPTNPTTTSPTDIDLDDGTIGSPTYGCPSGTSTAYVYGNGSSLRFGECVNTFAVSYAINQALQGSGVSIDKVHYQWKYIHCFNEPGKFCSVDIEDRVNTETGEITDDTYWDELVVVVEITDSNGNVVETKTWTMDTWYEWTTSNAHSDNEVQEGSTYWQIHEDNIEIYNHIDKVGTIRTPNSVGDIRFRITGYDKGNWDGYYGPIIKDLKTWFTYRANPCDDTALYDPSCPGYATAYAAWEYDQNCSANALYDSGCPGYSTAYYNQQCSADPLYDSGCDGYATAYYNQQCSADPLYDSGCDVYEQAYLTQQCNLDSHHSSSCPNYSWAVSTMTGAIENKSNNNDFIEIVKADNSNIWNALFYNESELDNGEWYALCNSSTNGCEDAVISSASFNFNGNHYAFLYTKDEDGNAFTPTNGHLYKFMTKTRLDAYCDQNALTSKFCDGYETAYYNSQCESNPLYDSGCPGYAQAYEDQQCSINPLHSTNCSGYQAAYYNQQCSADPLYDSGCPGYATAYYNQQCSADPLYDSGCDGYEQAYLTQQCNLDSHHSSSCPNYNWANTDYTQDLTNKAGQGSDFIEIVKADGTDVWNALFYNESELDNGDWVAKCKTYTNGCEDAVITSATFNGGPNPYVFLYTKDKDGNTFIPTRGHKYNFMTETKFDALCSSENALYSPMCDGYATAYFNQQCGISALYNSECTGYAAAYLEQQCSISALHSTSCSGYAAAYLTQQCNLDTLYNSACPGYDAAYLTQQCSLDVLYNEACDGYDAAY